MKQVTNWWPDTCDCRIQQRWDDATPEYELELDQFVLTCAIHKHLNPSDRYQAVVDENTRKNGTYNTALSIISGVPISELHNRVMQEADAICMNLHGVGLEAMAIVSPDEIAQAINLAEYKLGFSPKEYKWEFDEKRKLRVSLPQRISGKKAQLQAALDDKFGKAKVKVV